MTRNQLYIARRYARAYFDVYGSLLTDTSADTMLQAAHQLIKNTHLAIFFERAVASAAQQQIFIKKIIDYYQLPENCIALLELLVRHKRVALIGLVLAFIVEHYDKSHGQERFRLETSTNFDANSIVLLQQALSKKTGTKPLLTTTINQDLIAGFTVYSKRLGCDYSVAGMLHFFKRMQE